MEKKREIVINRKHKNNYKMKYVKYHLSLEQQVCSIELKSKNANHKRYTEK